MMKKFAELMQNKKFVVGITILLDAVALAANLMRYADLDD